MLAARHPAQAVLRSPGRPLEPAVRRPMEARLGSDLGAVRVHTDSAAAAAARALGALAYTYGADIAFATGRFAPDTGEGRSLLAHELTHVVQQRSGTSAAASATSHEAEAEADAVARRASGGEAVEIAARAPLAVARQEDAQVSEAPAPEPPVGETSMIWFELNSDVLRQDGDVDSAVHLDFAVSRIERHFATFGDEQKILVHGYASVEGDEERNLELSGRRAIRIKNLLLDAGIDSRRIVVFAHGIDTTLPGLEWNRRVEIELTPPVSAVELDETAVRATPCVCPSDTEVELDDRAISYVESFADDINRVAAARGISPIALAGAIAEEYDAQLGFRSLLDTTQNFILNGLWEWQIDVDRYFDIHHKLLNALENDVGDANFNIRTALSLVEAGEVEVPGSPPSDAQVSLIIDYLLEEKGTIEFSGAYLARAQTLFAPYIADYDIGFQEAVLIDYFNEGPRYYDRFQERRAANPAHTPCPGGAGCVVLYNRARLEAALGGPGP